MKSFEFDCLNVKTENELIRESLEKISEGEVSIYKLSLELKENTIPKPYELSFFEKQIDIIGYYSSKSYLDHNITPDWHMRENESKTASGTPLMAFYSKQGINQLTISLSDAKTPIKISAGVVEENGKLLIKIRIFNALSSKISKYETLIRIDRRKLPLYDIIPDIRNWWGSLGNDTAYVPDNARLPMYSTWYSFHQNTIPDEIIKECEIAKKYGMDSVIVDDGWQTEDNSRGYAYCGDWQISKQKIPDMKCFVDKIHSLGMKFIIWFSVPFVGYKSKNFERFKGMYLYDNKNMNACVLDPRFGEVREFLIDTYISYVKKYGWDGLKLDFIDSFRLSEESSTEYEKMDTVSLEDALEKLLSELDIKLKKINPEFLIEFRQSYIGPVICKYGNMLRVSDCPNDALTNRVGSISLRMTSDKIPVHSDMLMWNYEDTDESVMSQLLSIMFSVPQISVRLSGLSDNHKILLKVFLDFWRKNREIILDGKLSFEGICANYTMIKSEKKGQSVVVLYQIADYTLLEDKANVFNITGKNYIIVDAMCEYDYTCYDMYGNIESSGKIPKGVSKISLKNASRAEFKKL